MDSVNLSGILIPFLTTLFGGLLALAGSFGATWLAARQARNDRLDADEQRSAENAYSVMFSLLDAHNSIANLQRQIGEMFVEADLRGTTDLEPWAKVRALVGASDTVPHIDPRDTSFLIWEKKAELINEVQLTQKRVANILASSQVYNELRTDLHDFLTSNVSQLDLEDNTMMKARPDVQERPVVKLREAQLNNLLGQIMEQLSAEVPQCWDVTVKFKEAAEQRFGDKFPKFKLAQADE